MPKTIVIDLDDTLADMNVEIGVEAGYERYAHAVPIMETVATLRRYRQRGFRIVIHTSRNMRTFKNDVTLVQKHTLPIILEWLEQHNVPYDEVVVGKPWCGDLGFYVDDKAVRPNEFNLLSYDEVRDMLKLREK